ncbi:MAG: MFS transporter, partial [Anaerolineaceae bacterium]|nr:MFS transporter [Anaerolineaceae bacterium]
KKNLKIDLGDYIRILKEHKEFTVYIIIRFIHHLGATLLAPIISLYYIREVAATAGWIGIFSTTATAAIIVGYFLWLRTSRKLNYQKILIFTTFIVSLYPLLLSFINNEFMILGLTIVAGLFQAGIDLVFFDGLMKIIPADKVAIFISVNVLFQYVASFIGPLLGTSLAEIIGLPETLIFGSAIKFVAFILFAYGAIRQLKRAKENR